jgi:ribose transport system substrate-binding protein
MGEAEQQTEEVLRNNPDIVALATIGITQTRGSMLAVHTLRPQGGIALLAFDQDLDLMYSLRHGDLAVLIAQNTFEMGQRAMQMIEHTHAGEPMPATTRIAPVLITPANIDTPEIQQVLSMDWRPR